MMKKISKFLGVALAMALLLFTPSVAALSHGIMAMAVEDNTPYQHSAPAQSAQAFDEQPITVDTLSNWQANPGNYLVTKQITTTEENDAFLIKYKDYNAYLLSDAEIRHHTPLVMTNDETGMGTNGFYRSSEITLTANGYYRVSLDYYVKGDDATFYFNDEYLSLAPDNNWHTATFYVQTDRLINTTFVAEIYFGSRTKTDAKGAAYFDNFHVTAIRAGVYTAETTNPDIINKKVLTFANTDEEDQDDVTLFKACNNTDLIPVANTAHAQSYNNIHTSTLANHLHFADVEYFHGNNGAGNVILMEAVEGRTALNMDNYDFQPLPHEVYMFQFYSITSPSLDSFHFRIGNTYEEIAKIENYPYHNGWQLNTIFYITGHEDNQSHQLGFNLGYQENVTGWAAINDLRIYKVSGMYAENNRAATGVHDVNDLNATESELSIANAHFELGIASDLSSATYPYPLKADSWETSNENTNGIVNPQFWKFAGIENPGKNNALGESNSTNNNVYMLRNTTTPTDEKPNTLTSPELSISAATYISFDAFGKTASRSRAVITTEDGIVLGHIDINDNQWHHYEFAITKSDLTATRSYHLVFEMYAKGETYIDNVQSSTTAFEFATAAATTQVAVNLTTPLNIESLWVVDDANKDCVRTTYQDGSVKLENIDQANTVVKHDFAYTLTADNFYQITVNARGKNAYLQVSGFDGQLAVMTDPIDANRLLEYNLYFKATESNTSANFTITLGNPDDDSTRVDAEIYLQSVTINSIEESAYDLANDTKNAQSTILTASNAEEETEEDSDDHNSTNFFGQNWWFLIPTLITALAVVVAVVCFFVRKIRFDKHITRKTTSYARDIKMKDVNKKIVAEKAAKVDNVTDETTSN